MQETQFGGADVTRERRIIHFTSGETLDLDSEEEEEEEKPAFRDTERKARLSIKNLVMRVGRLSLLVCDFLGERLAGVLGLNDAKYQYAIDQHQREHKAISEDTGTTPLSPELSRSHYGATEDTCPRDGQILSEDRPQDMGQFNRGYQTEDSHLKQ